MKRRSWMTAGGLSAASAVGVCSLRHLFGYNNSIPSSALGALRPDPSGILALPPGFQYSIVERQFQTMDDGYLVPPRPDGMACFSDTEGNWRLMRNHELGNLAHEASYLQGKPSVHAYRANYYGGVTRVDVDPKSLKRLRSNLVLSGTARNCAGGVSPWGWLSCEESVDADHGYVFLCSKDALSAQPPRRIASYGRFRHEAATVDPSTLVAYMTEDELDSCLYRFVPESSATPFRGKLQALAIANEPGKDLGTELEVGAVLKVTWVTVNDDPAARSAPLRSQARAGGAALIRRGEGLWLHKNALYFTSTSGGPVGAGQVFQLSTDEPHTLTLIAQSGGREHLDMPDNLTVSPRGGVYLAEDGLGAQFIRGLLPSGELFDLAQNSGSSSEFAGICFSPDGGVLFANIQEDGLTLAIRGPFPA